MVRRMGVLGDDHRPSPPIMTLVTAALISSDDFVNVAHCGRCEHGRLLRQNTVFYWGYDDRFKPSTL